LCLEDGRDSSLSQKKGPESDVGGGKTRQPLGWCKRKERLFEGNAGFSGAGERHDLMTGRVPRGSNPQWGGRNGA